MAVVQDTLETVLRLSGAAAYIRYLNQAAQAHQRLSMAVQQQQAAQAQVASGLAGGRTVSFATAALAGGSGVQAAQAAASTAQAAAIISAAVIGIAAVLKASTDAFAEYDRALARTQLFLHNFGHNMPTAEIQGFARSLALASGTSQTEIVNLMGYLSRFGTSGAGLERASKVITGAAKAANTSLEEMARMIEMARRGRARELFTSLGIPIRAVEGQLLSLDFILQLIEKHTRGGAMVFANTLPGAMDRASAALEDLKIQFGTLISPLVITWLNQVTFVITKVADAILALNQYLGLTPRRMAGAAAAAGGTGGASQSEDYLRRIEFNTGPQGALGRALRGGGAYGELGGGLHIRDFNAMMRHVR